MSISNPASAINVLGRPLRLGVIGGGPGSFIGPIHMSAAVLDRRFVIAAGVLSSDVERAQAYGGAVDALLLDAWVPDQLGGTGHSLPLDWLTDFQPPLPWWLAGGIRPETVPDLLARLHPDGLDASSGVETSPGEKNLERIGQLLAVMGRSPDRDRSGRSEDHNSPQPDQDTH